MYSGAWNRPGPARARRGRHHAMARPAGIFEARSDRPAAPRKRAGRIPVMPLTRGACPGISQPMPTGDGLLARLMPSAPIPLDDFAALCDASHIHGNGIVEVTQRGSLQVRGLSSASASVFARTAVALGLGSEERPSILTSPLMGLDAQEHLDLRSLVAALHKD